jgi:hypothetical protein
MTMKTEKEKKNTQPKEKCNTEGKQKKREQKENCTR